MVDYSNEAYSQLQTLILSCCDYHYGIENGISAFWYWLFQARNHVRSLDVACEHECEYGVYEMPYWGKIIYSCHFVEDECMVYVHELKFNKRNFNAWLHHQDINEQRIRIIVNEVINKQLYLKVTSKNWFSSDF